MRGMSSVVADDAQGERARMRRWFVWSNVLQYIGIAAVITAANVAGREDLIAAGISIVVALHFVPLAYVFRNRLQYATAAGVLVLDVIAPILAPRSTIVPVSIGTGALFWVTAGAQLWRGWSLRGRWRAA